MLVPIFSQNKNLPKYQTKGSVGFDISANKNTLIKKGEINYIPTGLTIATPEGYGLFIFARSSLFKKGLMLANSVGIVDRDFNGKEDEIKIIVLNFTDRDIEINADERVAQGVFLPTEKGQWVSYNPTEKSRGGWGSTGEK